MRSAGKRSGVNWMRWKVAWMALASVVTDSVLASPGTPSMRMCWLHRSPTRSRSKSTFCPTMTFSTSVRRRWSVAPSCSTRAPICFTSTGMQFLHDQTRRMRFSGQPGRAEQPDRIFSLSLESACASFRTGTHGPLLKQAADPSHPTTDFRKTFSISQQARASHPVEQCKVRARKRAVVSALHKFCSLYFLSFSSPVPTPE